MAAAARQRIDELLLLRATEGLSTQERVELDGLLARHPDVDATAYERAAAAVCLATLGRSVGMPDALRRRLESSAPRVTRRPGER
jgi:hypothetical protein